MNAAHVEAAITDLWPSLPWDRLSKRQMQVVDLLVNGHSHEEMAFELGVALKTVETHLADVRRLLGLLPNRRPLANVLLSDIVRRHVSHLEAS